MTEKVKEQYNQFGQAYFEKRKNPVSGFWNAEIESPGMFSILESSVSNKIVLDAGCGSGDLVAKISKLSKSCVGIDISETMIRIAREQYPNLDFEVASINRLPFTEKYFDVVYSSLVMHYFQDLGEPLKEIARVLKPAGRFIFSIHHPMTETFIEHNEEGVPFKVGKYFHNEKYKWGMAGMTLESYHHTFENISQSAKLAGFLIRSIVEPRPALESRLINPEGYTKTRDFPKFCIFELSL